MHHKLFTVFAIAIFGISSVAWADAKQVADGAEVAIEFTVKLEDGTVAQSNVGADPLVFKIGAGDMLPALEAAITGLSVEETTTVTIPKADAYGDIEKDLIVEVEMKQIPEQSRQVGAVLMANGPQGQRMPVRVTKLMPAKIQLDYNHPLAGHDLTFDVKILEVR